MKLFLLIICILVISILGPGITGYLTNPPLRMGYCQTMKGLAESIALKNNFILVSQSSSAEALNSLNNEIIDLALIGRLASTAKTELTARFATATSIKPPTMCRRRNSPRPTPALCATKKRSRSLRAESTLSHGRQ